ncbi:hypothetical protein SH449x_001056 [Pirellulaceae bacterium SH449]
MQKVLPTTILSILLALLGVVAIPTVPAKAGDDIPFEHKKMETLGASLFAYAFDAHLNISLISDSYEGDVIDDERAVELLDTSVRLLDQVGPYVAQLCNYKECDEGDKKALSDLVKCFKAIKTEAQALKTYVESGEEGDLEKFGKKNLAADKLIREMTNSAN